MIDEFLSFDLQVAELHPAHLVAAEEEGQGSVRAVDLALCGIPDFGEAEIGPRPQHETVRGLPETLGEAGDDMLVVAQIHLLDEGAQRDRPAW